MICFKCLETSDEECMTAPRRYHRKRRRKEPDSAEDVIDGFLIKSFKTYPLLIQSKKTPEPPASIPTVRSAAPSEGSDSSNKKKEESTETSSTNAVEESYVSFQPQIKLLELVCITYFCQNVMDWIFKIKYFCKIFFVS